MIEDSSLHPDARRPMRHSALIWLWLSALAPMPAAAQRGEPPVAVGVAAVDITPDYPVRLVGYGARKTESEGIETRLMAKALAVGDGDDAAVLVAVDNLGVPARIVDEVAARLKAKAGLPRERLVVCSTHTHCGPGLGGGPDYIFGGPLPEDQQGRLDRYARELTDAIERVAHDALADRKPGTLAWGRGSVGFAANRRVLKDGRWVGFGVNPSGPVDHALPVLRVADPDGKIRAVLVGYACHCTTLGPQFNRICAEWAGYAAAAIERAHPGARALVVIGCGADANPEPRRDLDDARRHGAAVAGEVERILAGPLKPLPGRVAASLRRIELPFGPRPTREQLAERAKRDGAEAYFARTLLERLDRGEALPESLGYPVQTWIFGDALAMVFLAGEVVVDYALRIGWEGDSGRLWVVAYSNDVPCYIASKRVLAEGGYEADTSMIYYGHPARFAPEAEDRIVEAVHDLLPDSFDAPKP
jgi:hypothetical protein